MKRFKNILTALLVSFILFCYSGHIIADQYIKIHPIIERTAKAACSNSLVSSESSVEDDVSFILQVSSIQIINPSSEKYFSLTCISLFKLIYPIWLPPEI